MQVDDMSTSNIHDLVTFLDENLPEILFAHPRKIVRGGIYTDKTVKRALISIYVGLGKSLVGIMEIPSHSTTIKDTGVEFSFEENPQNFQPIVEIHRFEKRSGNSLMDILFMNQGLPGYEVEMEILGSEHDINFMLHVINILKMNSINIVHS